MNTMQHDGTVRTTRAGVERCHCGADMAGIDHCPCCGCEEHETTCDHVCARPRTRHAVNHADH